MAFSSGSSDEDHSALAEINMVPFIDVMLVLLIIFMVTAPLLTHAVRVDLPKASSSPNRPKPQQVQIAIDATQQVYWDGQPVAEDVLQARLRAAGAGADPPELQLRVDKAARYEKVAQVMSMAASSGVSRLGFVTDPADAR